MLSQSQSISCYNLQLSSVYLSPRWVCDGQSNTEAGFTRHLLQLSPTLSFQRLLTYHTYNMILIDSH